MALYISLFFAVAIFSLVIILLNSYGIESDKIKNRLLSLGSNEREAVLDEELNKSLSERLINPALQSFIKVAGRLLPETGTDNQKSENLRKMLRQAGLTMMPSEYSAIRIIIIVGSTVLFFIIGLFMKLSSTYTIMMPFLGAYASFVVMRFQLAGRIKNRKEHMESQLPDVLDMLSVNVEAGLGFEQAMLHIIQHFQGPLIDEFTISYREMTMGRSRREALTSLGERCDIDNLKQFTGAVIQAAKLGISLKNILHTQAAAIRQDRRSKVEEKAHKMSIKMLLPMVIFIFPVIFIMLMGPAVVSIMEMF